MLVFVWQLGLSGYDERKAFLQFGIVPSVLLGSENLPATLALVPDWLTLITSMFLHGGFLHLGSNMLYLWIFSDNVEDSMGPLRFGLFYILCGIGAGLSQAFIDPAQRADNRGIRWYRGYSGHLYLAASAHCAGVYADPYLCSDHRPACMAGTGHVDAGRLPPPFGLSGGGGVAVFPYWRLYYRRGAYSVFQAP